jgi:hypothetical protein
MILGNEIEEAIYEPEHFQQVLAEIETNFSSYFERFAQQPLGPVFNAHIERHDREREAYEDYLDLEALEEFEYDAGAFKSHTKKNCPIIRRCVNSPDEVMKSYRRSFYACTGRQVLDPVRKIAEFGKAYAADFNDEAHEAATSYTDLGLELLNEGEYGCVGVIGYGIQSSLLYGLYPRCFAHRSQDAVWALYFLSGRKDFGLKDGSEFMMVQPNEGTCEQNYFYPADLFGFYALKVYLILKAACQERGVHLYDPYRYIYLSRLCDHVGDEHRADINAFKWSSDYVESRPWF